MAQTHSLQNNATIPTNSIQNPIPTLSISPFMTSPDFSQGIKESG
tara:strand:- start:5 stop:139 length:135 start_codon:yes stop_codon:yes gene_type:complete